MAAVTASVVLATARTLLNDDAGATWTDATLFPKLAQAHRELQQKLRKFACPVMRATAIIPVAANATNLTLPSDLVEPIKLWETSSGGAANTRVPMTEKDPLPNEAPGATLQYWQWLDEAVIFLGASAIRDVYIQYWRSLTIPVAAGDSIFVINGENYLAPRVAALVHGITGAPEAYAALTTIAEATMSDVIEANRGRGEPMSGQIARP